MGAQESILRAAIATLIPVPQRGTAYGLFSSIYGVSWFVGSAAPGLLYDHSILALKICSVTLACTGFLLLGCVSRHAPKDSNALSV